MKRTVRQWIGCNPIAMAEEMSREARIFAFQDAKADIVELHRMNKAMCCLLRKIAFPRRGTHEDELTIQDVASDIQQQWTLEQLES